MTWADIQKAFDASKHPRGEGGRFISKCAPLVDHIDTILNGSKEEREQLKGKHFKLADTPDFFKKIGLTGDEITIKYGVIAHHKGKDADHSFTVDEWKQICAGITNPIAIVRRKKEGDYSLFIALEKNGKKTTMVGIKVRSVNQNIKVNACKTVFAKDFDYGDKKYEALYIKKSLIESSASQKTAISMRARPAIKDNLRLASVSSIAHKIQKSTLTWADIEQGGRLWE